MATSGPPVRSEHQMSMRFCLCIYSFIYFLFVELLQAARRDMG